MSKYEPELIVELEAVLIGRRYSPVVIRNYCSYAREFLDYLMHQGIPVADVTEIEVAEYLRHAAAQFRNRRGRRPSKRWHEVPQSGINALLRLGQDQWPPAAKAACAADALRFTICNEYETWLREERGLAQASRDAFLWEARYFLAWQFDRSGVEGLNGITVGHIDSYMDLRGSKLTRSSLKSTAERLRSLLRYLHRTARVAADLSPHIISPRLYAYEGMPSILERDQITAVLASTSIDTTVAGLRDHAILQLLATYGLRAGEVRNMRIEDIDWRAEVVRVRHSKTQAYTLLPLLEPVGEATTKELTHLVANKKADIVRIYLPPDANTLLWVGDHCLRTYDRINVIVAGKQPESQYLSIDAATAHCEAGVGIWDWASYEEDTIAPDVVMACAGDVPTMETLAAVMLLHEAIPSLKIRTVNIVDLMALQRSRAASAWVGRCRIRPNLHLR
ncbi:site-specific recombinase XerD [Agrobacterium tumefaciens]|uniref:Site-specific recombinase XerD n=1 Tax=Agrobacterium radiobacter TaxID=362 RepID=A0ABR6JCD4_AGRRD|nr:site-specific recombinase XerD [Agrobacterium radiobacter]MBB4337161.1 site-specific recombinase XerD [Agrobacterium radiobacter]MBB4492591.1 site-specific recombinase XerD [Agrobacterium radiobacter]MBB4497489.1 site-specific recombinase XerD [Agrobacterium radiobacter]MBB4502600.1 site-specific recombinase XerD [Agrobacterium radiobacter]